MDKHLHKDIGKQFSDEINKLNQQPRAHIWENIDKALDKTAVINYKEKFTRLRKKTLLLLLLLIGISTFSIIYINTSKNKNTAQLAVHNDNLPAQKNMEQIAIANNNTKLISKTSNEDINKTKKKQIISASVNYDSTTTTQKDLFSSHKLFINKKGKTIAKIINADASEKEIITNDAPEISKNTNQVKTGESSTTSKPKNAEKNATKISAVSKNDSASTVLNNKTSNNKKQHDSNPTFTLTAFVAPDYSAYRLENDKQNIYDNKNGIEKRERSDISSTIGILLGYKVGNRVTLQSGISYSSSNISIDPTKIYAENDNVGKVKYRYNTSLGYGYLLPSFNNSPTVGDSLFANGANHTLHYISIPIIIKYTLGKKKITFHPGAGVAFNFLTKATLTTDLQDQFNSEREYISKLEGIKKFSTSLIITPEVQYQLSKKWNVSVIPYFKYALGSINKGNVVKTYPYTFGLGVGVVYKF